MSPDVTGIVRWVIVCGGAESAADVGAGAEGSPISAVNSAVKRLTAVNALDHQARSYRTMEKDTTCIRLELKEIWSAEEFRSR